MFAALAKNRGFDRIIGARRVFARPVRLAPSNDNAVTDRAVSHRQCLVLVGRWRLNEANGRLEWQWTLEPKRGSEDPGAAGPAALPVGHTRAVAFLRRAWQRRTVIRPSHCSMLFGD
jgi:hypothetical protein